MMMMIMILLHQLPNMHSCKMKVILIYILISQDNMINNEPVLVLNEIQDDEHRALVQKLNRKQKEFFCRALHLIKTSDKPFYAFLSGGGGVGKSHLTKSIYQAALKHYNSHAGEDFHQTKILLLAPTGKAAFIIKGNTIHSALAIPAS